MIAGSGSAEAARCFNTDHGTYRCDMTRLAGGGMILSAPQRPTFVLRVTGDDVATATASYAGTQNAPLPGPFRRSDLDPTCWVSDVMDFKICAEPSVPRRFEAPPVPPVAN